MVQYTEWRSISDGSIISSIPDSVEYHIVASESGSSDGGSISSIPDQEADISWDAIGSPTYRADQLNGNDAAELDGSEDAFVADAPASDFTFLHDGTPSAVLGVFFNIGSIPDRSISWMTTNDVDSDEVGQGFYIDDGNGPESLVIANGSSLTNTLTASGDFQSETTHIIESNINVSNGQVDRLVDGTTTESESSGSFSSDPPENPLTIGTRGDQSGNYWNTYFAELMILKNPASGDVDEARNILADKYGVDI